VKLGAPAILLCLVMLGCSERGVEPEVAARPGDQFDLGYGQTARLALTGLTITFKALGEDSRCPEGADCIWAGNARVILTVAGIDTSLNSYLEPKATSLLGYKIQLLAVWPYPKLEIGRASCRERV
jgi:hypothetical protein